jgi:TonB family protein
MKFWLPIVYALLVSAGCSSQTHQDTVVYVPRKGITELVILSSPGVDSAPILRGDAWLYFKYPDSMRRSGINGKVEVEMLVNSAGRVVQSKIISASMPDFGAAVAKPIASVSFFPARLAGRNVEALIRCRVQFELSDELEH